MYVCISKKNIIQKCSRKETKIHTYIHACLQAVTMSKFNLFNVHTYIHTYIHTYMNL